MLKISGGTATGLLLLLVIVAALVTYKTAGALSTIHHVSSAGTLSVRPGIIQLTAPDGLAAGVRTFNYLAIIWPALAFGILISAAVRSFVPAAALSDVFTRAPVRAHLAAGASGSPLMLCSCCVAPIFSAVYERSARLGPFAGPDDHGACIESSRAGADLYAVFPADCRGARRHECRRGIRGHGARRTDLR
jgi:hypothetical protein